MHGDGWTIVFGAGSFLALMLAAALVSVRRPRAAPVTLAAAIACFALILAEELVDNAGWQERLPHLTGVTMGFELLIGPLLFLHIRSLTSPDKRVRPTDALHLVPFALATLWILPFYTLPAEAKLALVRGDLPARLELFVRFKAMHCFLYLAISLWRLRSAGPRDRSTAIVWYRGLIAALLVTGLITFALHLLSQQGRDLQIDSDRLTGLVMAFILCSTTFILVRRSRGLVAGVEAKYKNSPLTEDMKRLHLQRLLAHLEQERPSRDSELRLESLALSLALPRHHLTQILNESLGTTFYELINRWRVDDVRTALAQSENAQRSLLDLAYDAGFNSKATFNRSFKRQTGLTPSEYRKRAQQQSSSQPSE